MSPALPRPLPGDHLCADAGQSGVRLSRPTDLADAIVLAPLITDEPVIGQLAARIREGIAALGPTSAVAIGSSALPDSGGATELLSLLAGDGIRRVHLAHDSVTNYLAALGARIGVVVAAGTGVVTLAVGETAVARVDGWGYLIGDAGSGYWLGRAGLDAVMRAFDGRGPATALTPLVQAEFGDLPGVYLALQNDDEKVTRIAAWAQVVSALAETDAVCQQLCRAAGAELAASALAGLDRVGLGTTAAVRVGLAGKVLLSPVVRAETCRLIRARHAEADFVDSTAGSLSGVAQLFDLPATSALASRVDLASGQVEQGPNAG